MDRTATRLLWYRFRVTFRRRLSGYVTLAVLIGTVSGVAMASGWTVLGLGVLVLGVTAAVIGYRLAPHREAASGQATVSGPAAVRAALAAGLPAPVVAGARFALEPGRGRTAVPVRSVVIGAMPAVAIGDTLGVHASMGTGALFATTVVPASVFTKEYQGANGRNAIFVRLRPGTSQAAGLRSLQKIAGDYNQIARSPHVVAASHGQSLQLQATVLPAQRPAEIVKYKTMGTLPAILSAALAAGAVAALGLTLVASVRRRRRDFALPKTLGSTRRQLAAAVAWRSKVVAVAGLVAGVPLGIAAGRSLWILFARELSAVPDPVVPATSMTLAALAAPVLAKLVATVPGRQAAQTPAALLLRAE